MADDSRAYLAVGIAGVQISDDRDEILAWARREAADIDRAFPGMKPATIPVYTTIAMEEVRADQ